MAQQLSTDTGVVPLGAVASHDRYGYVYVLEFGEDWDGGTIVRVSTLGFRPGRWVPAEEVHALDQYERAEVLVARGHDRIPA